MADQAQQFAKEIEERRRAENQNLRFGLLRLSFESLSKAGEDTTPENIIKWANLLKDYVKENV
jgi:hypothetical protein